MDVRQLLPDDNPLSILELPSKSLDLKLRTLCNLIHLSYQCLYYSPLKSTCWSKTSCLRTLPTQLLPFQHSFELTLSSRSHREVSGHGAQGIRQADIEDRSRELSCRLEARSRQYLQIERRDESSADI